MTAVAAVLSWLVVSCGVVQVVVGQVVEGWVEERLEADAGAGIGEVDGARAGGWLVGLIGCFPAGGVGFFCLSVTAPIVVCVGIAPFCLLVATEASRGRGAVLTRLVLVRLAVVAGGRRSSGLGESAALVLQVGAPGGRGADVVGAGVLDAFQLGQQVVFDGPAVGVVEVDGLVQVGDAFLHGFDEDGFESAVVVRWRRAQKK